MKRDGILWILLVCLVIPCSAFAIAFADSWLSEEIQEAERRGIREAVRELDNKYQQCPKCWCPPADALLELEVAYREIHDDLGDVAANAVKARRLSWNVVNALGDTIVGMREPAEEGP